MKDLFEAQPPSPNLSNEASTALRSKSDLETGSNPTSRSSGDVVVMENAGWWCCCCCFPYWMDPDSLRTVLAEAMGTFILVFCICAIEAITRRMGGQVGLSTYAATAALSVVVVVFSIGAISGAHVNPAITIAFATSAQFPWSKVPLYIVAQVMGSLLATYVGSFVYTIKPEVMTTRPLQGPTSAFLVELIATFFIMFLASSLASQAKYVGHLSGFVVGSAIGLAVLITGPVSGGSMNPARSLGPAILSGKFDGVWIYLAAPTLGAVAGALLFHALRLHRHPCCSAASASPDAALLSL